MLKPGGGKNDLPNRAKRHFHVMNVTLPSSASINQIFGSMVKVQFNPQDEGRITEVWTAADKLVEMTIEVRAPCHLLHLICLIVTLSLVIGMGKGEVENATYASEVPLRLQFA